MKKKNTVLMGPKSSVGVYCLLVLLLFARLSDASSINLIFSVSPQEIHSDSAETSVQLTCTASWSPDLGLVLVSLYEQDFRIEDDRTYINATAVKIRATIDAVTSNTCYNCELHSFELEMARIEEACVSVTNDSSISTSEPVGQTTTPPVPVPTATSILVNSGSPTASPTPTSTPSTPATNTIFSVISKSSDFTFMLDSTQPTSTIFSPFVTISAESHILLNDLKASYDFQAVGVSVLKYFSKPLSNVSITPVDQRTVKFAVSISLSVSLSKSLRRAVDELITWTISLGDDTATVSTTISIMVLDNGENDRPGPALILCYTIMAMSCAIIIIGVAATVIVLCKMRFELRKLRHSFTDHTDEFRNEINEAKQASFNCWLKSWCRLSSRQKLDDEIELHRKESHDGHVIGEVASHVTLS